jgi:Flp pilus assembly pilin Flp
MDDLATRDVTPRSRSLVPALRRRVEFLRAEDGQGLAEYAMVVTFVGVVAIAALTFVGSDITSILSALASEI